MYTSQLNCRPNLRLPHFYQVLKPSLKYTKINKVQGLISSRENAEKQGIKLKSYQGVRCHFSQFPDRVMT